MPRPAPRSEPSRIQNPRVASIAVLLGVLAATVYLTTVLFALGDGGLSNESDHLAARITLGVAGVLAVTGFVLALVGFGRRGQRGAAFVGFLISGAFVAFVALSFLRAG